MLGYPWRLSCVWQLRYYSKNMEHLRRPLLANLDRPFQSDLRDCFRWQQNRNWQPGHQCENLGPQDRCLPRHSTRAYSPLWANPGGGGFLGYGRLRWLCPSLVVAEDEPDPPPG